MYLSRRVKMKMTFSRQFLDIAGIMDCLVGIIALIMSILVCGAGIVIVNAPELGAELPSAFGEYTVLIIGMVIAAGSLFAIFFGHLERAAAKDPSKIMPAWVLSILSVMGGTGSLIYDLVKNVSITDLTSTLFGLIFSILVLIAANNIKNQEKNKQEYLEVTGIV